VKYYFVPTHLKPGVTGTNGDGYALQVVRINQPEKIQSGDGHPFSLTEEQRHASRVRISGTYCLFRLWHCEICCSGR
jgi:hypothetical protein